VQWGNVLLSLGFYQKRSEKRKFSKLLKFMCHSRMYLSKWNSFEVSEEPGRDTQIEGSKERSHKKGQSGPSGAGWLTDIFYEDSCFSNLNQKVRERKLFTAGESQLRDTL